MRENYSLNFSERNDDGDTMMDVNISFENPANEYEIGEKVNTWLRAIGQYRLRVTVMPPEEAK